MFRATCRVSDRTDNAINFTSSLTNERAHENPRKRNATNTGARTRISWKTTRTMKHERQRFFLSLSFQNIKREKQEIEPTEDSNKNKPPGRKVSGAYCLVCICLNYTKLCIQRKFGFEFKWPRNKQRKHVK